MDTIIICSGVACIAAVLVLASVFSFFYERMRRKTIINVSSEGDWLFGGFHDVVYDMFCGKDETKTKAFGIDLAEYGRLCEILHIEKKPKRIIAMRIEGIACFIIFFVLFYIFTNHIVLAEIFFAAALFAGWILAIRPISKMKKDADARIDEIRDDIPRFLALLEKALSFPIDQAILITAKKFKSPLSDDLMDCFHQVSLGAGGWQDMLKELASVYMIDSFNDIVMDIVNAYSQGINIREIISRKAIEIEKTRMYEVESRDAKTKSMIFLPIMATKIIPMIAMMCYPMIKDLNF